MYFRISSWILLVIIYFSTPLLSVDPKPGSLIRDAKIEEVLKSYISPLFETAGLNPEKLNLYIIYDDTINAAATLDNTIIVNTGFLSDAQSADEVVGVLAHETAHIADGHVGRTLDTIELSSRQAIIGSVLGAALGAATGRPDVGAAVAYGSMHSAAGIFFHHSQVRESSADQGGLKYLSKLKWPATGLLSFMKRLQEGDDRTSHELYLSTHPLSRDRIDAYSHNISLRQGNDGSLPAKFNSDFERVKSKLVAYAKRPKDAIAKFSGNSFNDRYIKAIALIRSSEYAKAREVLSGLIKDSPNDYDLFDLEGQTYFEEAKFAEAAQSYKKAMDINPKSGVLKMAHAQSLVELGDKASLDEAEKNLMAAKLSEPYSPFVWHLLSIVYGKQGNTGKSALALAEKNILEGKFPEAKKQAQRAKHYLGESGDDKIRIDDIIAEIDRMEKMRS